MGEIFGHPECQLSDRDKRLFDKHNAPNQKGIKTIAMRFWGDQLDSISIYTENFEQITWKKGGCQNAMCKFFQTPECAENRLRDEGQDCGFDPKKNCSHYNYKGR